MTINIAAETERKIERVGSNEKYALIKNNMEIIKPLIMNL